MAQSFTDEKISQVYDSILHTDGALSTTQKAVYDGVGNRSTVFLSTTGCILSGSVTIGGVEFNVSNTALGLLSANAGYVVSIPSTEIIRPRTTTYALNTVTVSVSTGDIAYDGVITSLSTFWDMFEPAVAGDEVITLQKYYFVSPTSDTKFIRDIKINSYNYDGTIWSFISSSLP